MPPSTDKPTYQDTTQQHLHDYRVNRTRGKEVAKIPRTCIECGKDATPRYLYCCDAHAEKSRRENSRKMWKP
jgi:hypothetical protein